MSELKGKVAVITGASRGIGAAVAHGLAAEGVMLGLGSRSGDDLGLDAVARRCDVRDQQQVDALVAATVERFGGLDILVANAGVGAYGPFLDLDPVQVEEMIRQSEGDDPFGAGCSAAPARARRRRRRRGRVGRR